MLPVRRENNNNNNNSHLAGARRPVKEDALPGREDTAEDARVLDWVNHSLFDELTRLLQTDDVSPPG